MAKKEGASEKRRALLRGLRRKQLHLSAQELGQNQADRLNICYQQHTHDQRDDEGNHLFGNGLQANAAATDHFSILTKKYHAYLSFGIAEVDLETGDFYNTAVLLGPEGYIGKYRKMHQWETEKHWGVDGDLGMPRRLGKEPAEQRER